MSAGEMRTGALHDGISSGKRPDRTVRPLRPDGRKKGGGELCSLPPVKPYGHQMAAM